MCCSVIRFAIDYMANTSRWHLSSFFLYGSWDSLIFVISSLRRPDLLPLSTSDIDAAWSRLEQTYNNHPQLLEIQEQPLHVAAGRLCLKAWDVNPPSPLSLAYDAQVEPDFISALRSVSRASKASNDRTHRAADAATSSLNQTPASDANALVGAGLDLDPNFTLDSVDWDFWDQLISDHQQGG